MRVALSQISATTDPSANLELVRGRVAEAAEQRARVVVFPEATQCRFGVSLKPVAEPLDGPWASEVRDIATEHGVVVVAGMFTPAQDGRVRNTLLITGPGGLHLGYHKIHLFDAFGFAESRTVAPGERPVTFELDDLTFGVAVCYDVRFPELFRALADLGAHAVLLPTSWGSGPGKREQWELLVRARALDATTWVLGAGQADPGENLGSAPTGIGFSTVADPFGNVTAQLGPEPGILVVDVDTDTVRKARETLPVLANRRMR